MQEVSAMNSPETSIRIALFSMFLLQWACGRPFYTQVIIDNIIEIHWAECDLDIIIRVRQIVWVYVFVVLTCKTCIFVGSNFGGPIFVGSKFCGSQRNCRWFTQFRERVISSREYPCFHVLFVILLGEKLCYNSWLLSILMISLYSYYKLKMLLVNPLAW